MPDEITPTELRKHLYRILDEILASGQPLDIKRKGHKLRIVPVDQPSGVQSLRPHPGTIAGDPEELVNVDWSSQWKPEV
jgi:hypothetical protein